MRLPFGLDFVSLLVGILLAYFAIPWVIGLMTRGRSSTNNNAA